MWRACAWKESGIVDDRVFDRLAMTFGQGSRRTAILSALAGAIGVSAPRTEASKASSSKAIKKCAKKRTAPARTKCCKKIKNKNTRKQCQKKIKKINKKQAAPRCATDGDCSAGQVCSNGSCKTCPGGTVGCGGQCINLSVCPADQQHVHCNNSQNCICTRLAGSTDTAFCAVGDICSIPCGPGNVCPQGRSCVMTCCDGAGNEGLRCLPSCG